LITSRIILLTVRQTDKRADSQPARQTDRLADRRTDGRRRLHYLLGGDNNANICSY